MSFCSFETLELNFSRGGGHDLDHLQLLCPSCRKAKIKPCGCKA